MPAKRVSFTLAELVEVEFSLRLRLEHWDSDDEEAQEATDRAHGKVLIALTRLEDASAR